MPFCYIDTESRCPVPIERGTDLYTLSAACTLVQWAVDDGPVEYFEPIRRSGSKGLEDLKWMALDPAVLFVAHNAVFDRLMLRRSLGIDIPLERFRCTLAQAYAHGLPGSLELLGEVLQIPEALRKKADIAEQYGEMFWSPKSFAEDGSPIYNEPADFPEEWRKFVEYGCTDVEALRAIHQRLPSHNYRGINLEFWFADQRMNEKGFGFDQDLAHGALKAVELSRKTQDARAHASSGKQLDSARQRKMLAVLKGYGVELPNLKAGTIRAALKKPEIPGHVKDLLELRLESAKSSSGKYKRGLSMVSPDSRIRHTIQFSGATKTGRDSGRGFQPQNLPRCNLKKDYIIETLVPAIKNGTLDLVHEKVQEACANTLRSAIVAAEGFEFIQADWSNIENRVCAWMTGEEWMLEAYRALDAKLPGAVDLYKQYCVDNFGIRLEDVTDEIRQWGKVAILAFLFGGGVGALVTMAAGYNVDLNTLWPIVSPKATPEQMKKAEKAYMLAIASGKDFELEAKTYIACDLLKQFFRENNKKVNQGRYDLYNACLDVLLEGGSREVCRCTVWAAGGTLIIQLPSGRRLMYHGARVKGETVTDELTGKKASRQYISVMAARNGGWLRERLTPLTTIENITQAGANDVLRYGVVRVEKQRPDSIVMRVHDEALCEVPRGTMKLEWLIDQLTAALPWAPGLPLAASGWTGNRYRK